MSLNCRDQFLQGGTGDYIQFSITSRPCNPYMLSVTRGQSGFQPFQESLDQVLFNENYAKVSVVLKHSPSFPRGLLKDDGILSVGGWRAV